jgi:hypothetical protein
MPVYRAAHNATDNVTISTSRKKVDQRQQRPADYCAQKSANKKYPPPDAILRITNCRIDRKSKYNTSADG